MPTIQIDVPEHVMRVCEILNRKNGISCYIVGGAVRDAILLSGPHDWDIATEAHPEAVAAIFRSEGYSVLDVGMKYGTVTVSRDNEEAIEITTFRRDGDYSDGRRPDTVTYSSSLYEDLARRDFTINAMAYNPFTHVLEDPFRGLACLSSKEIRCVGTEIGQRSRASARFKEDALRIMRAVRFMSTLPGNWQINNDDRVAIMDNREFIKNVSTERIHDEFCKMMSGPRPVDAITTLVDLGLMEQIIPELIKCSGVEQNKFHSFDVFGHIMAVVHYVPQKLHLRLAALFHDIGKPDCLSVDELGQRHFYQHQIVSAKIARQVMTRMRFSSAMIDQVTNLVQHHMFCFDVTCANERTARRLIASVGRENIWDLIELRKADQMGSKDKVSPWTHKLIEMVEAELNRPDPLKLAVSGNDVMQLLSLSPSPEVGQVLAYLKDKVLDDPELNTREALLSLIKGYRKEG
jgi:tRNA nucleotidyltransferase (CCA-adding enzyme)